MQLEHRTRQFSTGPAQRKTTALRYQVSCSCKPMRCMLCHLPACCPCLPRRPQTTTRRGQPRLASQKPRRLGRRCLLPSGLVPRRSRWIGQETNRNQGPSGTMTPLTQPEREPGSRQPRRNPTEPRATTESTREPIGRALRPRHSRTRNPHEARDEATSHVETSVTHGAYRCTRMSDVAPVPRTGLLVTLQPILHTHDNAPPPTYLDLTTTESPAYGTPTLCARGARRHGCQRTARVVTAVHNRTQAPQPDASPRARPRRVLYGGEDSEVIRCDRVHPGR